MAIHSKTFAIITNGLIVKCWKKKKEISQQNLRKTVLKRGIHTI